MSLSFLAFALPALTCVAPVFGLVVYLAPRPIPHRTVWVFALAIGAVTTGVATLSLQPVLQGVVSTARLLMMYVALYLVPTLALAFAAMLLRTRVRSRALGSVALLVVFACLLIAAYSLSIPPFDLVNASG